MKIEKPTNEDLVEQINLMILLKWITLFFGMLNILLIPIDTMFGFMGISFFVLLVGVDNVIIGSKIRLEIRGK